MSQLPAPPSRQQLRLQSIAWALGAGLTALLLGLPLGLEAALRAGGCGLFYGLPAIGLWPEGMGWPAAVVTVAPTVMMGLIRAWSPLVGAALQLHLSLQLRHRSRLVASCDLSARRP